MTHTYTVRLVDSFGDSPDVVLKIVAKDARHAVQQAWDQRPGPLWSAIVEGPEPVAFHPLARGSEITPALKA